MCCRMAIKPKNKHENSKRNARMHLKRQNKGSPPMNQRRVNIVEKTQ
uniref:Uncharacterized protein n=1 Tax=Rhizophora mucronata TaxID=61149 RepID=A0A2P2QQW3_RHIMU